MRTKESNSQEVIKTDSSIEIKVYDDKLANDLTEDRDSKLESKAESLIIPFRMVMMNLLKMTKKFKSSVVIFGDSNLFHITINRESIRVEMSLSESKIFACMVESECHMSICDANTQFVGSNGEWKWKKIKDKGQIQIHRTTRDNIGIAIMDIEDALKIITFIDFHSEDIITNK